MTESERVELQAVLDDLHQEEADQQAQRGHASSRLMRAAARLDRLLGGGPDGTAANDHEQT